MLPAAADPSAVRPILSQGLGVLRERHGIERAIRGLYPLASGLSPALVGLMIAVAAWRREESRGGHFRNDFPDALPVAAPPFISLADALVAAGDLVDTGYQSIGSAQP